MTARFSGKSVIVTGAGSGIGYEMARRFNKEGANVVAADIDGATVPPGVLGMEVDVTDPAAVKMMISRTNEEFGSLDILCNNAGIGSSSDVVTCSPVEWDHVFAVNVRGVFLGMKYGLPVMLERGRGVIVNTASVAGLVGLRDRAAYCASKGAVIALTRQVALQWADRGIRCNCICPGTVDTPWVDRLIASSEAPAASRARLVSRQPIGRLGTSAEVAESALYLASDQAAFVTGTALVIDGGLSCG